jgi:hypothetical protein
MGSPKDYEQKFNKSRISEKNRNTAKCIHPIKQKPQE